MSPEETKVDLKQNAQVDKSIFGTLALRLVSSVSFWLSRISDTLLWLKDLVRR